MIHLVEVFELVTFSKLFLIIPFDYLLCSHDPTKMHRSCETSFCLLMRRKELHSLCCRTKKNGNKNLFSSSDQKLDFLCCFGIFGSCQFCCSGSYAPDIASLCYKSANQYIFCDYNVQLFYIRKKGLILIFN
jgi:hypothetical protein